MIERIHAVQKMDDERQAVGVGVSRDERTRAELKAGLWVWLGDWVVGREPPRMDRFVAIDKTGSTEIRVKIHNDDLDAAIDQIIPRFGAKP